MEQASRRDAENEFLRILSVFCAIISARIRWYRNFYYAALVAGGYNGSDEKVLCAKRGETICMNIMVGLALNKILNRKEIYQELREINGSHPITVNKVKGKPS